MSDEKKLLKQFQTIFVVLFSVLMLNTVGVIFSFSKNAMEDSSFLMFAFVTGLGWINTIVQFKRADIRINWKNK
ncbi:hypothetical protein [Enterococcus sp. AZ072]|uniref:hypothetical protein n=1 Tax=unclassified Enterococcus TaxID=2608891 RepID=UPI003D27909E